MTIHGYLDGTPCFDSGVELTPKDHARLTGQIARVFAVMKDGQWRTVEALNVALMARFHAYEPETSLSAQLRNLRKARFGGHVVERRRVENHYEFRLLLP